MWLLLLGFFILTSDGMVAIWHLYVYRVALWSGVFAERYEILYSLTKSLGFDAQILKNVI